MTTNKTLLVSGLEICLAFGFTSRSCSSKASGNTELEHSPSFVRQLAYRAHSVGVSRQCSWLSTTTQLYNRDAKDRVPLSLFQANTDVAEESITLQHRPGFRHYHTASDGRSYSKKYISLLIQSC